jgi:hypothetical protein
MHLEFECVSSSGDAVRTAGAHSSTFASSDVGLKCDVITLDNALGNEYASRLQSGKSLPINLSSYATNFQIVNLA